MSFLKRSNKPIEHTIFDSLLSILLLVGTILLPLFYLPYTRDVLFFPKSYLLLGIVVFGVLLWLVRVVVTKEIYIRRTLLDVPILLFLFISTIAGFASYSVSLSFLGRVDEFVFHVVGLLVFVLWYWLLIQQVNTTIVWRWMISALLLSGVFSSLIFLFSSFSIFQGVTEVVGINVVTSATSIFGIYIAVLTVISLGFLMIKGRGLATQVLPAIMSVLGFITLLRVGFTLSWFVFLVGLIVLLVLGMTMLAETNATVLIGVFVFFVASLLFIFMGTPESIKANLPVEVALGSRVSWDISSSAFLKSSKTFLFGSGPGTFIYDFSQYRPSEFNLNSLVWSVRFRQPYNTVFALLSEMGVLGFLSWLFMVLFAAGSILSAWLKTRPSVWERTATSIKNKVSSNDDSVMRLRLEIFVLVAGWFALTAGFFVTFYDMMAWWLWWTILALVLTGLSAILPDIMGSKKFSLQVSPQYALAASFAMVCVFVGVVMFGAFQARLYVAEASFSKASDVTSLEETEMHVQKAIRYRNGYVPYRIASARISLQKARELSEEENPSVEIIAEYLAEAVNDARFAADEDPKNVETWETLAAMYMNARVFAEDANGWAQDALLNVVELEPTNAIAAWRLGDTYAYTQDWEKAEKQYKQSIILKPDYLASYITLSQLYEVQNDLTKAINVFEPISQGIQNSPEVLFSLGRLFFNRDLEGDGKKAEVAWLRVLELAPNYSNALYSLGLLYEKDGNRVEALKYYKKVFDLNPDNEDVEKKVSQLSR